MKYLNKLSFILIFSLIFVPTLSYGASFEEQVGQHTGDARDLEYWIEYLDSKGVTTADGVGLTFKPDDRTPYLEPQDVPEEYFGDYDLYYSGDVMEFIVHIKNTGKRTYKNLLVLATQEFINYEGDVGEEFAGENTYQWTVDEISSGEEVDLGGSVLIPSIGESGLDQTHLRIIHWDKKGESELVRGGRIIVDDPQAGIWCPI